MKKVIIAAALSLAFAAPAFAADFTGPRVGVTVGIAGEDIGSTQGTTFGIEAGYDVEFGEAAVAGIQAEYQDDFDGDLGHELALTGRVGGKAGENALVYLSGGYSRFDVGPSSLDGIRGGLGVEFGLGATGAHLKLEQRYTNYEQGAELFQTLVGVGFRF